MSLDQIWEIRLPDISVIILALEHENTRKVSVVLDDELQKLIDVKALSSKSILRDMHTKDTEKDLGVAGDLV